MEYNKFESIELILKHSKTPLPDNTVEEIIQLLHDVDHAIINSVKEAESYDDAKINYNNNTAAAVAGLTEKLNQILNNQHDQVLQTLITSIRIISPAIYSRFKQNDTHNHIIRPYLNDELHRARFIELLLEHLDLSK